MNLKRRLFLAVLACGAFAAPLLAGEEKPSCPLHEEHQKAAQAAPQGHAGHDHHAALDARGNHVMGFEHTRTTHHFLLEHDGGVIQVQANDANDAGSVAQIRSHLAGVAKAFSAGDFSMPREIHDRVLPGVPEMARLKDAISYRFEEIERGARVRITTEDPEALAAVHSFLKSQIEDHRTGDPGTPGASAQ
jgi:hypothetical protein